MNQAARQNTAAEGRGVDWYFADEKFVSFFAKEFRETGYSNIVVHYQEAIVKKIEDCVALVKNYFDAWQLINQDLPIMQGIGSENE
jgi:hypothetical protein